MASSLLSDDELGYFMDMESLFNHPGWARLTKEIALKLQQIPDVTFATAKSYEDVITARVRHEELTTLLHYQQIVEQRRENLEREKQARIDELDQL